MLLKPVIHSARFTARLTRLLKNGECRATLRGPSVAGAKARVDFVAFSARLKPCPVTKHCTPRVFRGLESRALLQGTAHQEFSAASKVMPCYKALHTKSFPQPPKSCPVTKHCTPRVFRGLESRAQLQSTAHQELSAASKVASSSNRTFTRAAEGACGVVTKFFTSDQSRCGVCEPSLP